MYKENLGPIGKGTVGHNLMGHNRNTQIKTDGNL